METFIKSYDFKVWRVIKLGDIPIPVVKHSNEGQSSTECSQAPAQPSLENYIDEQMQVIQINSRTKNVLYNAISGKKYENISSCETSEEM